MAQDKFGIWFDKKTEDNYNLDDIKDRARYIKALNYRITDTYKKMGSTSLEYRNLINEIKISMEQYGLKTHEIEHGANKGAIQIDNTMSNKNNDAIFNVMKRKRFLSRETTSEKLRRTFERAKELGDESYDTPYTLERGVKRLNEYLDAENNVHENYTVLYGETTNDELNDKMSKAIEILRKSCNTESELVEASKVIDEVIAYRGSY